MGFDTNAILAASIALQFVAAFLALRLIKTTKTKAWYLISSALVFMGLRRMVTLIGSFYPPIEIFFKGVLAESIALLISFLMVAGVFLIADFFRAKLRTEEDVQDARVYAESIVETVREPLVVLDADLRVISANQSFYQAFQVSREETENNLIYELGDRQWDIPDLRKLLEELLPNNTQFRDFEIEHEFPIIGHKVMLLNARRIYREGNRTQKILLAIEDITERKRADAALRESEKFFSGTLNDMLTFVAVLEPDGKVIFVNNTPLDVAGITLDDVKGKMFYDAFWWQYSEEARQQIKEDIESCASGETLAHEIEIQTAEGGLIWIEYSMHPIYDDDGKIKYLVPEGRDITDRKRAEEHIQHLQRVLKAIRNINQLIVHEKNRQKLLQGACEILNQTRDYKLVWIGLVEEGTKDVLPAAQAGYEEGYLKSVKITWDDSEAGKGPTGTAIKTKKPFVMRGIVGDPRYKPWREEAIKRGYASSAAVPLVYEDRVFGALNVYAAFSDAFDEEEIALLVEVGQDIAFALHNIELEEERKLAEEALRKARDELEVKVAERTKELAQANIKLQELDRLKSMFIASMSHELRTPLNSIIGFTGIILQGMTGEINEEQRKQLTMVKNSANHLLSLINDIIDLSKIEADKVELAIGEFDLSTIVQEVKDSFRVAAAEKCLKLSLKMPKRLAIKGDERRTKQVLMNLVGNAIKFTEDGEIEIKVAKMDGMVEVSVRDTGIGIRKEDMDRLFKPFSQNPAKDKSKEGTGLGLYLSKKIAELLGGNIWAESELGKGSVFTFALPLKYQEVKT
jgi:PAS domain S-box-containing protein